MWERRAQLRVSQPQAYWPALFLLALSGAAWLVAEMMGIMEAEQFAILFGIQGILLSILGKAIYRTLLFPFLYLFFLVPTGDFLTPSLQNFTANFIVYGLKLVGIPVYSDGIFISIPTGNFEVAEACAGLRFLTATLAYGLVFADFAYTSLRKKLVFCALCFVTPIIANGLRAYGIVLIAYLSNNELATGIDHIVYGWIFFSFVMLMLTGIGMLFRDTRELPRRSTAPAAAGSVAALAAIVVGALILIALPRAYAAYLDRPDAIRSTHALTLPAVNEAWSSISGTASDWQPSLAGPDRYAEGTYVSAVGKVDLFVGYYDYQTHGKKLVSSANRVADAPGWTSGRWFTSEVTVDGRRVRAAATQVFDGGRKRLVLSWYWVDHHFVGNPFMAKLLRIKGQLFDSWRPAAVIAVSTEIGDSTEAAEERLARFVTDLPGLDALLTAAADR